GTPKDENGVAQHLVVLGMGKLGGHELNLSSDIDLIFAYPEEGQTLGGPKQISNHEFFQKVGQRLINVLSKPTADGFVFRVDMRLRPFGSGALAISFDAIEDYYQIHGREWERYAMIKARVIAGDKQSGEELLQRLHPFVYRRYVDYSAFESIREMKAMIQKEVQRKNKENNIKVGAGGIREIEFIGQVFQLIRGGRELQLQSRSILKVLDTLKELHTLPEYAVKQLKEAYDFLRRTEHRIQAWRDEQTHSLPMDELGQLRLAYSMGFESWDAFHTVLVQHRTRVHEHFEQVFVAPQSESPSDDTQLLTPLWMDELEDEEAVQLLTDSGFEDAADVWRRIKTLRQSRAYNALSARGKDRMDRLMPLFLSACQASLEPSLGLLRSLEVIEAVMQRSVYLALLIENPVALSQFVRLCASSPWITRYLSQHPLLLDDLLDVESLYNPPDKKTLHVELTKRMAEVLGDEERSMDVLRHFKHSHFLRVAAADIFGVLPLMEVSNHLSWIAEVVLEHTLNLAWQHMVEKHGRPVCTYQGEVCDTGFAVIAYGKLGGLELGYGSDLDLVFLHSGESESLETTGAKPVPLGVFFARLGQRMMHILSTLTPAGQLFEVDMRLRPEGASGMLVSGLKSYEAYQLNKAWTWEHQALVRARVVAGDPAIATVFTAIRNKVLAQARNRAVLKKEVLDMRQKMLEAQNKAKPGQFDLKHSQGGIVDIEFMVQYGVLAYSHDYPELLEWTDNIRLLETLARTGVISKSDAEFLAESYRIYRNRLHRLKLQQSPAIVDENEFAEQSAGVRRIWSEFFNDPDRK
ncbi:MAG: bifunctional [glutamate--ammonia ligase]-adenylyl-L-tyrosine phosphorylase/[glutamate--ammonia-ligase] adenylyltransferase, partial [Thioalkalispiraceae bacterium]